MRYVSALSILIAAVQAGIVAALGAQISGFALPPAVTFGLMVSGAMLAVVSANLPAVALNGKLPAVPTVLPHTHVDGVALVPVVPAPIDPSAGLVH